MEKKRGGLSTQLTRKLPGLTLVEVNFGNGSASEVAVKNFLEKVVSDEFFISWVKPKARRQMCITVVKVIVGDLHDYEQK